MTSDKKERGSFIEETGGSHDEVGGEVGSLLAGAEGGETLSDWLTRGPLHLEQLLRVAIEVASTLDQTHRQRRIYGDLNPHNILMTNGEAGALRL